MNTHRTRGKYADFVSATEIACYVSCPEQWRQQYGLGVLPENQAALAAGKRHHARKTLAEMAAGGAIAFGQVLVGLAVLLTVLLWLVGR